jgi:hypothetical protein
MVGNLLGRLSVPLAVLYVYPTVAVQRQGVSIFRLRADLIESYLEKMEQLLFRIEILHWRRKQAQYSPR